MPNGYGQKKTRSKDFFKFLFMYPLTNSRYHPWSKHPQVVTKYLIAMINRCKIGMEAFRPSDVLMVLILEKEEIGCNTHYDDTCCVWDRVAIDCSIVLLVEAINIFMLSNFNILLNFLWITFPIQSYLVLYSFCASLLHSFIIIIIIIIIILLASFFYTSVN